MKKIILIGLVFITIILIVVVSMSLFGKRNIDYNTIDLDLYIENYDLVSIIDHGYFYSWEIKDELDVIDEHNASGNTDWLVLIGEHKDGSYVLILIPESKRNSVIYLDNLFFPSYEQAVEITDRLESSMPDEFESTVTVDGYYPNIVHMNEYNLPDITNEYRTHFGFTLGYSKVSDTNYFFLTLNEENKYIILNCDNGNNSCNYVDTLE